MVWSLGTTLEIDGTTLKYNGVAIIPKSRNVDLKGRTVVRKHRTIVLRGLNLHAFSIDNSHLSILRILQCMLYFRYNIGTGR